MALALVVLSLLSVLAPLVANAQTLPGGDFTIAFDKSPPDYQEGDKVTITLGGALLPPGTRVEIHCRTCPDKETTYNASAQRTLTFPDDFGSAARSDQQPKWNDSWQVDLLAGGSVVQSRDFRVWAGNFFDMPDTIPRPSNILKLRATAFQTNELIQYVLRHRRADGTMEVRFAADVLSNFRGESSYYWQIPLDEAQRLRCPLRPKGYCERYELTIKGPGKLDEKIVFRVHAADLYARAVAGQGIGDVGNTLPQLERTINVSVRADIPYPGGLRLRTDHLVTSLNPNGILNAEIVRRTGDNGQAEPEHVANLTATFDASRDLWAFHWTIPKDIPIRIDYRYSLHLLEQKDKWGNVVHEQTLNNFTVVSASLTPVLVFLPSSVERLGEAKAQVAFLYHDASAFSPNETANGNPPVGCFVRDDPGRASCVNGQDAKVAYWRGGVWNFTTKYPVDYPDLSGHQFLFEGGTLNGQDKYGNVFARLLTQDFTVTIAHMRVNLTTVVKSELRTLQRGLDRGDRVEMTATITYPDGSAFNVTMNEDRADKIPVLVTKVSDDGATAGDEIVNLTSLDGHGPQWVGAFTVSKDASLSPLGRWTFTFHLRDNATPPNENDTVFARNVNPAQIQVVWTKDPARTARIGALVSTAFQLVYVDGTYANSSEVGTNLLVQVVRASQPRLGAIVSGNLLPTYEPSRHEWSVEWEVPGRLFQGNFAFKPLGTDRHGNVIDRKALSRPFATFTDSTVRAVLTDPPSQVERGSQIIVVFDGRDGDVSPAGFPGSRPVIELQRFDSATSKWIVERADTRSRFEGDGDHVGRLNTTIATTLGLYRFQLRGRDGSFNLINGTTQPFTVVPTNVSRPLLVPPPERVAKGQYILWSVEREAGDELRGTSVLYNGAPLRVGNLLGTGGGPAIAGPISQTAFDRYNFSWRVPYSSDNGNYSFTIRGFDAFQNRLIVDVPAVQAEPSVLTGKVIGSPERVITRAGEARFLFAITYPNGDFFASKSVPRVIIVNDTGVVANSVIDFSGLSYQATWRPPLTTRQGEFWFEVTGQDASGNVFPALRSETFRVDPGTSERPFVSQPKLSYSRLDTVRAELPSGKGDAFAAFTLSYIGDLSTVTQAVVGTARGTTVANLEHSVDPNSGRYVVAWRTTREEKVGIYRIEFSGQDQYGNEIRSRSEPFRIVETALAPSIDPFADTFKPGTDAEFAFDLVYATAAQTQADPATVAPEAFITYSDGASPARPIAQRPDVAFDRETGKWTAAWHVPSDLPNGKYQLIVQGQDDAGNPIRARASNVIDVQQPVLTSFKKVFGIPGPDTLGLLAAALGAAALLALVGRGRRRR